MNRCIDGTVTHTCTLTPWTDDIPHRNQPQPKNGFVIVMDRERIFKRGNSFERQSFCITLHEAGWPDGMVVRDLVDNKRYEVVGNDVRSQGRIYRRQKLCSLCGGVELLPRHNGSLKRVEKRSLQIILDAV